MSLYVCMYVHMYVETETCQVSQLRCMHYAILTQAGRVLTKRNALYSVFTPWLESVTSLATYIVIYGVTVPFDHRNNLTGNVFNATAHPISTYRRNGRTR